MPALRQGLRTLVIGTKIIEDNAYQVGGPSGCMAPCLVLLSPAGALLIPLCPAIHARRWHAPCCPQEWDQRYQEAASSFVDRDEKLDALGKEIEQGLELIGVTAIEDKLQVLPQAWSVCCSASRNLRRLTRLTACSCMQSLLRWTTTSAVAAPQCSPPAPPVRRMASRRPSKRCWMPPSACG